MANHRGGPRKPLVPGSGKVGFIGLGNQGAPLAERIVLGGYETVVWARRAASVEPFAAIGATIASSLTELASAVDVLCICVVDDAGVRQVAGEAIPAMAPGTLLVIHSTVHPETCVALARDAATRKVGLLDAPVSGGAGRAREGRMTVMVGGSEEDFTAAQPLFATFASLVELIGDVGAGQKAKLINNTLMAANLMLAQEAVEAGVALGLDRAALDRIITASSGGSFAHGVLSGLPNLSAFESGARLLRKDVALLEELALASGVSVDRLVSEGYAFLDRVTANPAQTP